MRTKAYPFAVVKSYIWAKENKMKKFINIALPKGRLGEKVYAYFERAGYE